MFIVECYYAAYMVGYLVADLNLWGHTVGKDGKTICQKFTSREDAERAIASYLSRRLSFTCRVVPV